MPNKIMTLYKGKQNFTQTTSLPLEDYNGASLKGLITTFSARRFKIVLTPNIRSYLGGIVCYCNVIHHLTRNDVEFAAPKVGGLGWFYYDEIGLYIFCTR